MVKRTSPIDWEEDVCYLRYFMAASYENKIYTVGGRLGTDDSGTEIPDSYLRILDFSKPTGSSKTSIDISTDYITTAIRLPDSIPRLEGAVLLISDGVMHMLPGRNAFYSIADADGNALNTTIYQAKLAGKVWDFDLKSQKWGVHASGIKDQAELAAVAYDAEKQVGWYYGGISEPDRSYNGSALMDFASNGPPRALKDVYRLDKGTGIPVKVEADSSFVGNVNEAELVYIAGVGKAGILVLIGGDLEVHLTPLNSMKTVHVFDIATKVWFAQPTTARAGLYPMGRVAFCSVVASAEDKSSHNIYIYGGWDPIKRVTRNEVFILTLPAFHWISVYPLVNESDSDIRQTYAHRCQKVHEKHMVAYRGYTDDRCDYDKRLNKFQGMAIYDMSTLKWTTKVELENQNYLVPQILYDIIGGNATGNSNITEPNHGFLDSGLAQVFINKDNTTTNITTLSTNGHSQGRTSGGALGAGIAIGIVGGLVLVLVIGGVFLLWRRHRKATPPQPPSKLVPTQKPQDLGPKSYRRL